LKEGISHATTTMKRQVSDRSRLSSGLLIVPNLLTYLKNKTGQTLDTEGMEQKESLTWVGILPPYSWREHPCLCSHLAWLGLHSSLSSIFHIKAWPDLTVAEECRITLTCYMTTEVTYRDQEGRVEIEARFVW